MLRIAWKFVVRPERAEEFERHYGSDGTWAALFRRARGYLGTELYRDGLSYVTIDTWESRAAFEEFRRAFGAEYAAVDREMEELTLSEEKVAETET